MKKLNETTIVDLGDDVKIYITNIPLKSYNVCETDDSQVICKSTGEKFKHITIYQQLYNSNGELLDKPIQDDDSDYYYLYANGLKIDCKTLKVIKDE